MTAILTEVEARILGCLIEKEATTPDQYPLTENALTLACNQKTSRDPVMDLSAGQVGHALRELEPRQLVRSQHASRAQRWEHRFTQAYGVTAQQQAALCVLMLRGPQTLGEIHSRTERIGRFADAEQVRHTLERLAQRSPALVQLLPRAPGQREDRWVHLLCGPPDVETLTAAARASASAPAASGSASLLARLDALEERLAALEARLDPESTGPAPPDIQNT
ncbi:MAG: YceH family protein [Lysobacteraceae bacterium]